MTERDAPQTPSDAHDLQTVAALLLRAGIRLPASQIAELVPGFRADRAKMAALRTMLVDDDETAHVFVATPARKVHG